MRNLLIIIIIAICTIGIIGCVPKHQVKQTQKPTKVKQPDWSKTDPLAFLNILKNHPESPFAIWNEPPQDWIKEEHVSQLMKLIDSQEPAAPVVSAYSSYYPFESSTVGNEAMFLIEGFRKGRYPPGLVSIGFKGNPDEFRKWWNERKTQ